MGVGVDEVVGVKDCTGNGAGNAGKERVAVWTFSSLNFSCRGLVFM